MNAKYDQYTPLSAGLIYSCVRKRVRQQAGARRIFGGLFVRAINSLASCCRDR